MSAERYLRLGGSSAEGAVLAARAAGPGVGFAVDADLLAAVGPAVVSALDEVGPVLVGSALSGTPPVVGAAAARFGRLGASWITVASLAGAEAVRSAVAGVAGTGCRVVVETMGTTLGDAEVSALTGVARGRLVSRLAAMAAGAGAAGVWCALPDLGVVAQVAPDLVRVCPVGDDADEAGEAERRGAALLVVAAGPGGRGSGLQR